MSTRVFTLGDLVRTRRIPTRAGLHFYQGVVMDVNEAKQLVRLHNVGEFGRLQRAALLGSVKKLQQLVGAKQVLDVDCRHGGKRTPTRELLGAKPRSRNQIRRSSTARSSPTRSMIACALSISSAENVRSSSM